MKKLLIMLMVVAMASFLFVGCLPGVTPVDEEEEEEEVTPTPLATVAPIITSITDNAAVPAEVIDLTSTKTQYINKDDVALGIVVNGTAPTYSEVKVYIDDICAGTGNVGDTGIFSVDVAKADLGADGDKVLYATAKEAAIAVSPKSVEYAFTLDTVAPKATELKATADAAAGITTLVQSGVTPFTVAPATGGLGTLTAGVWYVKVIGSTIVSPNVTITEPDGNVLTYTLIAATAFDGTIPDITFTIGAPGTLVSGSVVKLTIATAIADRATVLFDEEVTYASAMAITNAWRNLTTAVTPTATTVSYSNKTLYFTPFAGGALARYDSLRVLINGAVDLAGNTQTTASAITCTVGKASLTSLAP